MADLPSERLTPCPPFTYVGADCFGPFLVKDYRKEIKRYGVVFTCMASRAVHLEVLDNMTSDDIINAIRRVIAIRGPIRQLRSDQGRTSLEPPTSLRRTYGYSIFCWKIILILSSIPPELATREEYGSDRFALFVVF